MPLVENPPAVRSAALQPCGWRAGFRRDGDFCNWEARIAGGGFFVSGGVQVPISRGPGVGVRLGTAGNPPRWQLPRRCSARCPA